jgi:hypothetical protein
MKLTSFLSLLMLLQLSASAQFKPIAGSPVFDEPQSGYARILHMKNGNTAYVHIFDRKGVDVQLYDTAHHQIAMQHSALDDLGQLWGGEVNGIFEIQGDITLFISEYDRSSPVLYRVIIDGQNGAVKETFKLFELEKQELTWDYHYPTVRAFHVRKDPNSDNYVVACLSQDNFHHDKKITLVAYDGTQRERDRIVYTPDNKYNFINFVDLVFLNTGKVSLLAYGYNKRDGDRLLKGTLLLGGTSPDLREACSDTAIFSKDQLLEGGAVRFDPNTQQLMLVGCTNKSQFLAYIDPATAMVMKELDIQPQNITANHPFTGIPQDLFLNDDGSFYIVYQEMIDRTFESSTFKKNRFTLLNNILVGIFDKNGHMKNSRLIPTRQAMGETYLPPFYHAAADYKVQPLYAGDQYKTFGFVNLGDDYILLLNDVKRYESTETTVNSLRSANAYVFTAQNASGTELYEKHGLDMFTIADYDPETRVYTTLRLLGKNEVQLVWLSYL